MERYHAGRPAGARLAPAGGARVIVFARIDRRCRPRHLRLYPRQQHQLRALPAADRGEPASAL